jgi:hypothetical protein
MSHHDDDPLFDEYLKRDSALSKNYKDATQETVPLALDQKILMQARDAVNDKKVITPPSWWMKWNKPLALAASLMLAFTVMYRIGHQSIEDLATPATTLKEKIATATNAPATVVVPQKEAAADAQSKPALNGMVFANEQPPASITARAEPSTVASSAPERRRETPPIAGVLAAAPVMAAPASASTIVADKEAAKAAEPLPKREADFVDSITAHDIGQLPDRRVAEPLQRVPGVKIDRSNARDAKDTGDANSDPEALLQHIRELREQGKKRQADKAWKQFQKNFPDYAVAADDAARGYIK